MNRIFLKRQHQSSVMKNRWFLNGRDKDIEQIMKDLNIHLDYIDQHRKTDAEKQYLRYSYIGKLNPTYVDHKFMAHNVSGILLHADNTFRRIASKDSALISKQEELFVLGKNIAYEHFLFNYTNYLDIIHNSKVGVDFDGNKVQYLFKPPSVWPWVITSPHIDMVYDPDTNEESYLAFRVAHDVLY